MLDLEKWHKGTRDKVAELLGKRLIPCVGIALLYLTDTGYATDIWLAGDPHNPLPKETYEEANEILRKALEGVVDVVERVSPTGKVETVH